MRIQQLFDEAIGDAPPSTVDIDAAVRSGRASAGRRRRSAFAAGFGVLAVALSVSVLATLAGPVAREVAVRPGLTTTTAATVATDGWGPQSEERLSAAARAAVLRELPGAQLGSLHLRFVRLEGVTKPPSVRIGRMLPGEEAFIGGTELRYRGKTGRIDFSISRTEPFDINCGTPAEQPGCSSSTGPHGEKVVAYRWSLAHEVDVIVAHVPGVFVHVGTNARLVDHPRHLFPIALDPALIP